MSLCNSKSFPPRTLVLYEKFFEKRIVLTTLHESCAPCPLSPPRPRPHGLLAQVANKKFSSLNAEYEITFESSSQINAINDDSRIMSMT